MSLQPKLVSGRVKTGTIVSKARKKLQYMRDTSECMQVYRDNGEISTSSSNCFRTTQTLNFLSLRSRARAWEGQSAPDLHYLYLLNSHHP